MSWLPRSLILVVGALGAALAGARAAAPATDRFAPPAPPSLVAEDRTRLAAGEVLLRALPPTGGQGIGLLMMSVIDAAPAEVWRVMADCDAQDEFMPRVVFAEVRDRDGDRHTCELEIDLPFPLDNARTVTRHHVYRLPDGGYQRRWELLPGDASYHKNRGFWTVHPYADGARSLLVGRMDLLPKSVLPDWLIRAAQTRQAPATFEAIRKRVAERSTDRPDSSDSPSP